MGGSDLGRLAQSVHACERLRNAAAASSAANQQGRSDSPPTRRCSSHSPSCLCQQRRRQRRTSCPCSPTPRLSRQPAQPRPAGRSDVEPAACARLIRPAQRYEPASGRSSRCERHLEFAAATATAVGRQRHHALRRSEKSSAYHTLRLRNGACGRGLATPRPVPSHPGAPPLPC